MENAKKVLIILAVISVLMFFAVYDRASISQSKLDKIEKQIARIEDATDTLEFALSSLKYAKEEIGKNQEAYEWIVDAEDYISGAYDEMLDAIGVAYAAFGYAR